MGSSSVIKGPKSGAGELGAGNPGKSAMRVKPRMSAAFEGGANSYSPKKMSIANKK